MKKEEKNNKTEKKEASFDFLSLAFRAFKDSLVNVLIDGFGQMKKEIKNRMNLGVQTLISLVTILIGLIFILNGMAKLFEAVLGVSGAGFLLTGLLVVLMGVWFGEKIKAERQKLEEEQE